MNNIKDSTKTIKNCTSSIRHDVDEIHNCLMVILNGDTDLEYQACAVSRILDTFETIISSTEAIDSESNKIDECNK